MGGAHGAFAYLSALWRGGGDQVGPRPLTLWVDPADALELQHDAPRRIERINADYGYRAISRITNLFLR